MKIPVSIITIIAVFAVALTHKIKSDEIILTQGTNCAPSKPEGQWVKFVEEDGKEMVTCQISTNLATNWVSVLEIGNTIKQQGFVATNRVLLLSVEGKTNIVILKQLGIDEWSTQKRIVPKGHNK